MADLRDLEKIKKEEERILRMVQRTMQAVFLKTVTLPEVRQAIASGKLFWFSNNPQLQKSVNKLINNLNKEIGTIVLSGIEAGWKVGESTVWRNAEQQLVKTEAELKAFNKIRDIATASHRERTAQSFFNEKKNGFDISQRIWKNNQNIKSEIEIIIQNGMKEGKPADVIAKGLQQYLKQPEKLFRRVRNKETMELELSKAASNYHPGRGVYRSAYMNARRLAVTEVNRAFREAEWQSYQNNPLITGYRIELSNNHTCSDGKGGIIQGWTDICDDLKGVYPITFKWYGWHPLCRCRMVPIMIGYGDFASRVAARARGTLDQWQPRERITTMPDSFIEWAENNQERIDTGASVPYFIVDNFKAGKIAEGLKPAITSLAAVEAPLVIPRTDLASIIEGREDIIRKNKNFETAVVFDDKGNVIFEKKGERYSVSFTPEEALNFRDNIFTHNHPRGWESPEGSLGRIGSSFSAQDVLLAIKNDVKELRAVTPKMRFSMERPQSGWPSFTEARIEIRYIDEEIRGEYIDRINAGTLTEKQSQTMHFHELWKRFAERYKINYFKKGT